MKEKQINPGLGVAIGLLVSGIILLGFALFMRPEPDAFIIVSFIIGIICLLFGLIGGGLEVVNLINRNSRHNDPMYDRPNRRDDFRGRRSPHD